MTREIPLTKGYVAVVDDEDHEWLSERKWRILSERYPYPVRTERRSGRKVTVYMHREILGITHEPPSTQGDHINGNRLDNRRTNLRICTQQENNRNMVKQRAGSSQFKGVYWDALHRGRPRWVAQIKVCGKHLGLGRYDLEADAARAYDEAAKQHFGKFAYLNFRDEIKEVS